jgi:hypothetical protein
MTAAVAAGMLAFSAGSAAAQTDLRWKGSGGWGPGSNYSKLFDPKTMETVKGTVVDLETFVPSEDMFKGVTMNVKQPSGEILPVHLGPSWYLENQDTRIAPNDRVEVKGSRVTFNGKPALIAVTVIKGGAEVLRLRDDNGYPRWSALETQSR